MLRIKPLETEVVNRIAAGEIIIAPANALKELLENLVDAGSGMVEVVAKEGGLKLLVVSDDGSGIDEEDLGLLCQRFATSKLVEFEDLRSIATYGFRGEALALISHIAHVLVVTKTAASTVATKAVYTKGVLDGKQVVAGRNGTTITVEDLFYNVPLRRRLFRLGNEEHIRLLEVVQKYAVHTQGVGFSVKKGGDLGIQMMVRKELGVKDRVRLIYGSAIANELVEVVGEADPLVGLAGFTLWATSPSYSPSKRVTAPIFFINNRLVGCDLLRRALQQVYSAFLPKGAVFPFIYCALRIDPANVDVNVHPTKREVGFLYEEEVVAAVAARLQEALQEHDNTRVYNTQLPAKRVAPVVATEKKQRLEHRLVRIDASQSRLSGFLSHGERASRSRLAEEEVLEQLAGVPLSLQVAPQLARLSSSPQAAPRRVLQAPALPPAQARLHAVYTVNHQLGPQYRLKAALSLQSVRDLRQEYDGAADVALTLVFQDLQFVGVVDASKRLCAFQHGVQLFLCDYGAVCEQLFRQVLLAGFGSFGRLGLVDEGLGVGLLVRELLEPIAAEVDQYAPLIGAPSFDPDTVVASLGAMKEMFGEYFGVELVENGSDLLLNALPILVKHYTPPFAKLGVFLVRLGTLVDYSSERACLDQVIAQLAWFHVPLTVEDPQLAAHEELATLLEDVLFPLIRSRFVAPALLLPEVVEVANLPGLYKVFERC